MELDVAAGGAAAQRDQGIAAGAAPPLSSEAAGGASSADAVPAAVVAPAAVAKTLDEELDALSPAMLSQVRKGKNSLLTFPVPAAPTNPCELHCPEALLPALGVMPQFTLRASTLSQVTALRVLAEFTLLHGATVTLLLKKDTELWAKLHPVPAAASVVTVGAPAGTPAPPPTTGRGKAPRGGSATPAAAPAAAASEQAALSSVPHGPHGHRAGALIKTLLHRLLTGKETALLPSLAERASHLLQV